MLAQMRIEVGVGETAHPQCSLLTIDAAANLMADRLNPDRRHQPNPQSSLRIRTDPVSQHLSNRSSLR
jgi:hypothetical protein